MYSIPILNLFDISHLETHFVNWTNQLIKKTVKEQDQKMWDLPLLS